jgi:hypothetical protein
MAGSMRRFGEDLFGRRGARSAAQVAEALAAHRNYVYGVRELTVRWGQSGAGQTGARLFRAHELPALKHWNPDVAFREVKTRGGAPSVSLELGTLFLPCCPSPFFLKTFLPLWTGQ